MSNGDAPWPTRAWSPTSGSPRRFRSAANPKRLTINVGRHKNMPGDTVLIDLGPVRSTDQLMEVLGIALELGGPNGNVEVQRPTDGQGWGKNWNALLDSLMYLDTGGIWGTSRRLHFPLQLEFQNSSLYRNTDPQGYAALSEVLESARKQYAVSGLKFGYAFK